MDGSKWQGTVAGSRWQGTVAGSRWQGTGAGAGGTGATLSAGAEKATSETSGGAEGFGRSRGKQSTHRQTAPALMSAGFKAVC